MVPRLPNAESAYQLRQFCCSGGVHTPKPGYHDAGGSELRGPRPASALSKSCPALLVLVDDSLNSRSGSNPLILSESLVHIVRGSARDVNPTMTATGIAQLPYELLAQIGSNCDAQSALDFSATCPAIRAACFDSHVFKRIITNSQLHVWSRLVDSSQNHLNIDAVTQRCGDNASAWIRYAIADQAAYKLWPEHEDNIDPSKILSWAPELFVVNHPFLYHSVWTKLEPLHNGIPLKQRWCSLVATLAHHGKDGLPTIGTDYAILKGQTIIGKTTLAGYVQALRWTILEARYQTWPFWTDPKFQYMIPQPYTFSWTAGSNLLSGKSLDYLPAPYSARRDEWMNWAVTHHIDMMNDLTSGCWSGFSTYFDYPPNVMLHDVPSIKGIRFRRLHVERDAVKISVVAEPTVKKRAGPSGGHISIVGSFSRDPEGTFVFTGREEAYQTADKTLLTGTRHLSLMLTAFGLIGYWGNAPIRSLADRCGTVWLWKDGPNT